MSADLISLRSDRYVADHVPSRSKLIGYKSGAVSQSRSLCTICQIARIAPSAARSRRIVSIVCFALDCWAKVSTRNAASFSIQ